MGRGVVGHGQRLVIPFVVLNHLVILLRVFLVKMPLQVSIPCALCVEIVGYTVRDFALIVAISFAASLLEGCIVIRNTVLTCIMCRPSAPCLSPFWQLESSVL